MIDVTKIVLSEADRRLFDEIHRTGSVPVGGSYDPKYFPLTEDGLIAVESEGHTQWGDPVNPHYVISNTGYRFIAYERQALKERRSTRSIAILGAVTGTVALLIEAAQLFLQWLNR